ncbi:protein PAXX isoform X1 [Falco biarmicus]|uniref:protein PAXX isoform X1 n=1 Tax=Falco biarmicus TaxID=345155 RepID=UPI0024BC17D1|nr:protein PAXX isoform X1 [Falco biarmicus]
MAEPAGPFRLLRDGPRRYLCYCGPGGTVYVTDALEVWAGELDARPPLDCVCTGAGAAGGPGLPRGWGPGPAASGRAPSPPQRCQPEEHGTELREALGRGAAALSLGEGKATLQLREEARCSALELFKLPMAQARSQLQALVFDMAGCIESLERRLEAVMETLASSCSPEKNTSQSQQLFLPGRQLLGGTPLVPLLVCLLFPRRLLVRVLSKALSVPSAVAAVSCPAVLVPFLAWKGPGLSTVALGVCGIPCAQVRCWASPDRLLTSLQEEVRLHCSSRGFTALPDWGLWQVYGSLLLWERRPGLALPHPPQMLGLPGWAAGGSPWAWRGLQGCQSS